MIKENKNTRKSIFALTSSIVLTCSFLVLGGCGGSDQEKAEDFVKKGIARIENENYEAAKIEFTNAIRLDSQSQKAIYNMALIMERERNWPEFERNLKNLLEINPEHVLGRLRLTNFYIGSGNLDIARTHAEYLMKTAPTDSQVQLTYGAYLYKANKTEKARPLIDKVLKNEPDNIDALFLKISDLINSQDYANASVYLDKSLEAYPDNLAFNMSKLQILKAENDWPGMVKIYQHIAKLYPESSAPVTSLAEGFAQRGNTDKAIDILETYAVENKNPNYFLQTVHLVRATKGFEESEKALKNYVQNHPDIPALKLALADLFIQTDRADQAQITLTELAKSTKDQEVKLECFIRLGTLAFVAGDLNLASQYTNKALAIDKKHARATALQANLLLKEDKIKEAVKILRTAVRDNQDSSELYMALGRAHEKLAKFDRAEDYYNKAHKAAPDNITQSILIAEFFFNRGRIDYADRLLSPIYDQNLRTARVLQLLANIRIAQRDWNSASIIIDELKLLQGQTTAIALLQSDIHAGKENYAKAISTLLALNEEDLLQAEPLAKLISAYTASGKSEQANEFISAKIKKYPKFLPGYFIQAQLLEIEKRYEDAITVYNKILDLDESQLDAHLKSTYLLLHENQYEKAQAAIDRAKTSDFKTPQVDLLQAILYKRTNELEKAIAVYERLLKMHPDFDIAANNLANAYLELGGDTNLQKAEKVANRFRQSSNPVYIDTLGWIYVQQGNIDEGLSLLRRAASKLPNEAEVQYHLGVAFSKAGKNRMAKKKIEKAVELSESEKPTPIWLADAKSILDKSKPN